MRGRACRKQLSLKSAVRKHVMAPEGDVRDITRERGKLRSSMQQTSFASLVKSVRMLHYHSPTALQPL